ncbi:hypothetical protein BH10PSE7_BH10PSE7_35170 [soil metagenome]
MTEKRGEKLEGLSLEEKRKRWRAAPQRLFWKMAAASGADIRFKRRLAIAAGKRSADKSLRFHIPFAIAERALGEAAIIMADPRKINRWLISEGRSEQGVESPRDYFLVSGRWESLVQPIGESDLDGEVRDLIATGGEVRLTPAFERLAARLRDEGPFVHNRVMLAKESDLERYLTYHAALIESIRQHGVVRRRDLARIGPFAKRPGTNGKALEAAETDSGVAIGPGGRLLRYRGGFHRNAAARELGLKRMPVHVKLVHVQWLRRMVRELNLSPHEALLEGLRKLSIE